MGALISVPASCLASAAGSCAAGTCCAACTCRCFVSHNLSNYIYVALVFAGALAAAILRFDNSLDLSVGLRVGVDGVSTCVNTTAGGCDDEHASWYSQLTSTNFAYTICSSTTCAGYFAVYRISFVLAVFFTTMIVLTLTKSSYSASLHRGFWWGKMM